MEWMNKGDHPAPTAQPAASHSSKRGNRLTKGLGLATVVLLYSVTIVVVSVLLYTVLGTNGSESHYVDKSKLQAVFLNGGQVYFGNIKNLSDKSVRMTNIYYLRVNQTVQPNGSTAANNQDISLVKLGCELHGPTDEMLINRDQVVFWENLKTDGQVAKAVAAYVKQNPNGQNCSTQSSTSTGTTTNTQTTTGTDTTTTTPTTKK